MSIQGSQTRESTFGTGLQVKPEHILFQLKTPPRYEKKFGKESTVSPIFALAQNAKTHTTMTNEFGSLPCFTTGGTTRLFHRDRQRWLTAREKAAATGLAVSAAQAKAAGIGHEIDWAGGFSWHTRIGNGQILPNVGLVQISFLSCLKLKEAIPHSIFAMDPPSEPKGFTTLPGGKFLIDIGGVQHTLHEKKVALEVRQCLQVACFTSSPV